MTLCAGFVDSEFVYLVADSVVTSNQRLSHDFSSFGELQHSGADLTVQERALKILRYDKVAATFSSDADCAHQIFVNFVSLSQVYPIRTAFENACLSSVEPSRPSDVAALLGYYDAAGPYLVKFVNENCFAGIEVQFGCIGNLTIDDAAWRRARATMCTSVAYERLTNNLVKKPCDVIQPPPGHLSASPQAGRALHKAERTEAMLRVIAVALALALASSAQAVPLAPLQPPDGVSTEVAYGCGAGRTRVQGVCVARTIKRQARRADRRCPSYLPKPWCV
jgi:hypothetical protein